ncbi:MAG: GNAT family N-acetyltransferase [Armatimonadetes bacterium]|nr:GNAT family N-acetyltransferase [Armatimonadota bacterium]
MSQNALPQLLMRLASLEHLTPPALPQGYTLRTYQDSDKESLARTLNNSFPGMGWSVEMVGKRLLEDPTVSKTFVVTSEGAVVATASSRYLPDKHLGAGYLHWVGTDPAHQGKKLGMIVSYGALEEFRRNGYAQAVLNTDDFRKSAIAIYLKMGFIPEASHESHPERWKTVLTELGR